MLPKIVLILPEIALVIGAVIVTVLGLSRRKVVRDSVPAIAAAFLIGALVILQFVTRDDKWLRDGSLLLPGLARFGESVILVIALGLVLLSVGGIDRKLEIAFAKGRAAFDAIRVMRGEYHAFFLLSVAGTCLLCTAPDLIWVFLAVELVSLPTYIMVATSRSSRKAQEAAVKYFFLGAMSSAMLLYGFALLYGATGTLELLPMQKVFAQQAAAGGVSGLAITGFVLSIIGLCFKISAAPMHFYAPDVYEGAATPVTAFLAFIPKAAGFITLILLLSCVGWEHHVEMRGDQRAEITGLPSTIAALLWMIAIMTMTLGNVGALLQRSVKRMLAYSSIAHSGYMIIGLIAGPVGVGGVSGINATLFYLLAYAVMTVATFGPLASLERNGEEIETIDDIAGLRQRHPWMAAMLAIGCASLIGLPPLLGFWGKFYLFAAGLAAGHTWLVVAAAVNSGISVWYYLRLMSEPFIAQPNARSETVTSGPSMWPRIATIAMALALVFVPVVLGRVIGAANTVAPSAQATAPAAADAAPRVTLAK